MPVTRTLSSGTDLSLYKPYGISGTYSFGLANTYYTLVNITGKGFISASTINTGSSGDVRIKITIDGVVKVWTNNNNTPSQRTGFIKDSLIGGRITTTGIPSALVLSYPQTSLVPGNVIGDNEIYFNTSCLIEISCNSGGLTADYIISGGVQ